MPENRVTGVGDPNRVGNQDELPDEGAKYLVEFDGNSRNHCLGRDTRLHYGLLLGRTLFNCPFGLGWRIGREGSRGRPGQKRQEQHQAENIPQYDS